MHVQYGTVPTIPYVWLDERASVTTMPPAGYFRVEKNSFRGINKRKGVLLTVMRDNGLLAPKAGIYLSLLIHLRKRYTKVSNRSMHLAVHTCFSVTRESLCVLLLIGCRSSCLLSSPSR